jgi:glycosyltransferase involved in cell wall biosynthesis
MQPRISIITPSFNQGRYLGENILSVANQGYANTEHIVIDGGSTDDTKQVLEKHKDKLAYSVSERDNGQSDAVNKGFAKATGDIIGWLNSDDYYSPGALNAVAKAFVDPSVNVVCGYSILFDEKSNEQKGFPTVTKTRGLNFQLRFADINQPATFFRRSIMAEFMPLNTTLHYLMDRELWTKYIQQYGVKGVVTIDATLVHFRYHADSKSESKEAEFDNEYATMLHWFALQNKLTDVAELLKSHYSLVKGYTYSFNKNPDKENTLNMIRYFFLKKGGLVFTKEQFDYAKKGFKVFDIKHYKPLPEEKNALKRMESIVSSVNWTHFRVKRKIDSNG